MDRGSKRNVGASEPFEGVAPRERIQLAYRSPRSAEEVELPLRLLMLGDFTQRPDPRPLGERTPIAIDKDSFARVMHQQRLDISFSVDDTLSVEPGRRLDVRLRFRRLSDMEPEAIANQVPRLKALLELRHGLTSIKGPLGGERAFRNILQRLLGDPAARRRLREEIGIAGADAPWTPPPDAVLPLEIVAVREQVIRESRAEALREAGTHRHAAIRAAAAGNPDTPPDLLFTLSREFPEEVAQNPVLPLLAIEIDDWLLRLSAGCLRVVLRQGAIAAPEDLLAQLGDSLAHEVQLLVGGDPRTPPAVLTALARKRSWYLDVALFENPSLPLSTWQEMLSHPGMMAHAARYPHAPLTWLRAQATSPSNQIRASVAAAPHLPEDTLAALARDADSEVRAQIARRADLPEALARALATDTDLRVRSQLAANPRTPVELLPAFADDCDVVRNGLLGNRLVPAALRERVCAQNRDEWSKSELKIALDALNQSDAKP
jgi:type VI secretion system protein ImpB